MTLKFEWNGKKFEVPGIVEGAITQERINQIREDTEKITELFFKYLDDPTVKQEDAYPKAWYEVRGKDYEVK